MQLKYFLTLLALLVVNVGFTRSNISPSGARAQGMGNAFVSQSDIFSVYHNQAGLAKIERNAVGFFYENRFLVKEMSLRAGAVVLATNLGNFAVQYNSFGPARWSESNGGLSYAKKLTSKLSAGVELSFYGTRFPESNSFLSSFSFDIGAIYDLNSKTSIGLHVANPYSSSFKTLTYEEKIPWAVNVGGHTAFTNEFTLSYQLKLEQNLDPSALIGAQWEAAQNFFIRGGYNSGPSRLFAGLGYHSHLFEIETAFSYHQYLGYTPSVSLIIKL